jgi:hypothetical protein
MDTPKMFKWTVEFSISENWVADGFDLTDERALSMLSRDLGFAYEGTEIQAKVVKAPSQAKILKAQGY